MRLAFRTKLLASHVALVAVVVMLVLLELNRVLGADLERQLDQRLEQQAAGAAQWVGEGRRHPDKLAGRLALVVSAEVTIYDRDGNVLGEAGRSVSAAAGNDDGARSPEVVAAKLGGFGHDTRVRSSTGEEMHYVAVQTADGEVLRLGAPLSEINATVGAMRRRLLFASALAIAAALGLGFLASQVAARPLRAMTASAARIAQGDYDIGVPSTSPDEFGVLSQALSSLATQLKADMTRIRQLMTVRRDFVANVSHELRTPVTAIQGYAETLLRSRPDEETTRQFLEIMFRQSQRIGALVEGLLRLSELEARPPEQSAHEPVDVGAVAAEVVRTMQERAAASGAVLELDVAPDAVAMGDPVGVEQVLENLVDNALKYGKAGGKIRIEGRAQSGRVALRVTDEGPGIEARHLPRLFERFYRVDSGRSRERGGTGLGLSIVKHLVESMGGTVSATSEVGRGSCFLIELPASQV